MQIIKRFVQFFVLIPAFLLLYINGKLYYSPNFKTEGPSVYNQDVLSQLRYLKNELHNNQGGEKMQALFPEGFVFTTALYGLAWADFVAQIDKKHPLFQEANKEIKWSIGQVNSTKGKAIFAKDQFEKYKKHFIEYKFGLPAVREYPIGVDNDGDVDSGPVIMGVGASASIVAIRAMAENKEAAFYVPIRNAIEAFGFPNSFGFGKKYVLGELTVADAFIAWSNAKSVQNLPNPPFFWRMWLHLFSLCVLSFICWFAWKL